MIKNILYMLRSQEHYVKSDIIEIAKGKYEIPSTLKMVIKQIKRKWQTTRK
jgi:hypothetical protein